MINSTVLCDQFTVTLNQYILPEIIEVCTEQKMQQSNSESCLELHLPIIFLPLGRKFRMNAQTWAIHSVQLTSTLIPAFDKALFRFLAIVMSFKSHKDCLNVFLRIISSNEICTAFTCTFVSLFLLRYVGLRTGNHNCGLEFLCIVLLSK